MEIKGKVHCFFEQSGTFKREFVKLGIPAEDYDIQNNFGETDHVIDLFHEIDEAWDGRPSVFDGMTPDDLVMAFFPCIRFCNIAEYNQRFAQEQWRRRGIPSRRVYEMLKKTADERHSFYILCLKMFADAETRGIRLVMENPWAVTNYTNYFFFAAPSMIDEDRTRRGDFFVKPTAFWFVNCEPCHGFTREQTPRANRRNTDIGYWSKRPNPLGADRRAKGSATAGICSEERSMISPAYARNFIRDNILGTTEHFRSQLEFEFA